MRKHSPASPAIAIIGGGASGLYAAAHAALQARQQARKVSIHIFEKNPCVAKKLAITGSSQCNLTHELSPQEMAEHYYEHNRAMRSILSRHSAYNTISFFTSHGLTLTTREDGKVFPSSFDARDVIQVLTTILEENDVEIHTSSPVSAITYCSGHYTLTVPHNREFTADALIIATGGFTYPDTGSTGDGYRLAKGLSHTVTPLCLALSPVKVTGTFSSSLSGITVENAVVYAGGQRRGPEALLFTHQGLSGPVILHSSRFMNTQDIIRVSFIDTDEQVMYEQIRTHCAREGKKQLLTMLLSTALPRRLLEFILTSNGIDGSRKGAEIGKQVLRRISRDLTGMSFEVSLNGMAGRAIVTSGGISIKEVELSTMESKLYPHLYFCGEVLDLDGETGGYNLQVAWSTSAIAAGHCLATL